MPELQQRLGHVHLKTTMRYAKYAPKKRDAHRAALGEMGIAGSTQDALSILQQQPEKG